MSVLNKLKLDRIDRRVWYILLLVMVSIPLIRPLGLPIVVGPEAKMAYNFINNLPAGSAVVVKSTGSSIMAELGPVELAILKQLFSRSLRVLFLFPTGTATDTALLLDTYYFPKIRSSAKYGPSFNQKVYGEDYIVLPYITGDLQAYNTFAADALKLTAGLKDYYDRGYVNDFPIMQYFKSARDWSVYICAGGEPSFTNDLQAFQAPYGVPFIEMAQSMHWATHKPYLDSGQLVGITNGLNGGAEYEMLINEPTAAGIGGMDAFSVSYVILWVLLLWGNVSFLLEKRKKVNA